MDDKLYKNFNEGDTHSILRQDQYKILKYGEDGTVSPPDEAELEETFGTTDEKAISYFMATRGTVKESPVGL